MHVAELPFSEGTEISATALARELVPGLRDVQKPDRLDRFDKVFYEKKANAVQMYSEPSCTVTADQDVAAACSSAFLVAADRSVVSPLEENQQETIQNGDQKACQSQTKSEEKRPKKKKLQKAHTKTSRCWFEQGTPSAVGKLARPVCLQRHPKVSRSEHEAMDNGESARAPLLSEAAKAALASFPSTQFFAPGGKRAPAGFRPQRQGIFDLYSGDAGVARALSRKYGV